MLYLTVMVSPLWACSPRAQAAEAESERCLAAVTAGPGDAEPAGDSLVDQLHTLHRSIAAQTKASPVLPLESLVLPGKLTERALDTPFGPGGVPLRRILLRQMAENLWWGEDSKMVSIRDVHPVSRAAKVLEIGIGCAAYYLTAAKDDELMPFEYRHPFYLVDPDFPLLLARPSEGVMQLLHGEKLARTRTLPAGPARPTVPLL